jgi:predicted transporter
MMIITSLGSLFFIGLILYYSLQKRSRHFVPATLVIALGCLSSLTRSVFVPSFPGAGGIWRLLTALFLIGGGIMYQREWNRTKRER